MATLEIGTWSSKCLECNGGADPNEKTHKTLMGYGVKEGEKGCGVKWDTVTTGYVNLEKRVQQMRPDLKFVSVWHGA